MTTPLASVSGYGLQRCELHVPQSGVPWADVRFGESVAVSGAATLKLGSLSLVGTVDPRYSGAFGAARSARIVGGHGAWGAILPPRSYHSDAGVSAKLVASDAARECGETLGEFVPGATKLGNDWTRVEGPASATLEEAAGGVPWYVGLDGVTRVGVREEIPITGTYSLLTYSPQSRIAVLSVDEPATVQVGSVVSDRLAEPHVAREVVYTLDAGKFRVECWLGGDELSDCRLHDALNAWLVRASGGRLYGLYRYRVVSMIDKRVRLQAVSKAAGLPDQIAVSEKPGIPGAWAQLTPGVEALVVFVAGSPSDPILVGFGAKDDPSGIPILLQICGDKPAARQGDAVTVFFPPEVPIAGTLNGVPFVAVATILSPAPAQITSGSAIVGLG